MNISKQRIHRFQKKVFSFYEEAKRDLPWRKTKDPYAILVSEIMLQQTQVDRVIPYYHTWMKKWPTVERLANAKRSDILKAWMGLGYNSRALYLHDSAQKIVTHHKGNILKAVERYKELPGIGPYTAKAIEIFSVNKNIVTVDTNIRRIFIHEFGLPQSTHDKELWKIAEQCLVKGKSRGWHYALMDYGALFLTAQKTGIKSKTQQSPFKGSDREIRAKILKHVLKENRKYSFEELKKMTNQKILHKRLKKILEKMVKENLLEYKQKKYSLCT